MTKRVATPKLRNASIISTAKIATRARSERNRLRRRLRAFLMPGLVAEFSFDRVGHRLENRQRASPGLIADKAPRPCVDASVRIRLLSFGEIR